MANGNGDHQLKRIVLPSGKTIEVVYFESLAAEAEATAPAEAPATKPARYVEQDLHVCPECSSELVYPVAWEEADEAHWSITLRCPNCEWGEDGVFDHPTQKPVLLFETAIRNHLRRGEAVYDPFVGSGTAIIAAERLGRRCFAVDIDPRCVQLSIERWQAFTGRTAVQA